VVVELLVVVAMVLEVEVAVAGGVPFGHPFPPKMSTIISISLSDKVVVLKKNYHGSFYDTALPEQPPPRFYPL
jgi:hypothetical protein